MNMKFYVCFTLLFVAVTASQITATTASKDTYEEVCYKTAVQACQANEKDVVPKCNAKYGGMQQGHLLSELQKYANLHIKRSFEHLLVSTHFANYENNREGFAKLFDKLSDEAWNDGIEIIKHISKRGGHHQFNVTYEYPAKKSNYEEYELQAMARAVDVQKHLAEKAFEIHHHASRNAHLVHDAEIAHYIEEEFAEKQAESVRTLVGHVTDLRKLLIDGKDGSLALHLFDEYLVKSL